MNAQLTKLLENGIVVEYILIAISEIMSADCTPSGQWREASCAPSGKQPGGHKDCFCQC